MADVPLSKLTVQFVRAACNGEPKIAAKLLAQHLAIASKSLHAACAAANLRAVGALLKADAGALTAPQPDLGGAPLVYACASHMHRLSPKLAKASLRCVKVLLDAGADPNTFTLANSEDPQSKLSVLYRACVSNNVPVVKLLLERGAEVNDGESLYHAAELNHPECMELLVAHGAEISARHPHWNNTVLYFLSHASESLPGMRWMLRHGADPNVTSYDRKEVPLHSAAASGNLKMIDLLLKHGADPNAERADGRTVYASAVRSGVAGAIKRLKAAGARTDSVTKVDELLGACMRGKGAAVRRIVKADPRVGDSLTDDDRSLLTHAAGKGLAQPVRLLLSIGLDPAWEHPHGGTALHWGAWWGRPQVVRLLLKLGAPIEVRDKTYGSSPVAWAAHGSRYCRKADADYCAVVDALIRAGSSYEFAINRWGEPLQNLASPRVRAHLVKRGFVPREG